MPRRFAPLIVLAGAVLATAPAHAALVYDKNPLKPSIWIAADDGSGARRLAAGSVPKVSADGATVAYMVTGSQRTYRPDLVVVAADGGGAPRLLAKGWRDLYTFAWSRDSWTIATVVGPELGTKRLVLIDVATGTQRTIARGFFSGVSFSPDGGQLVYARSATERYPLRSDIYRADLAEQATPVELTADHRSSSPLWGPNHRIVYVRHVDAKRRRYGPKNELYLMAPDGSGSRRLTKTKVDPLLTGLAPTAWSADGTRLLAEFGGQDTSYAETVNPATGAHRPVGKAAERGLVGFALSHDGSTILGATGGFDPGSRHDVVAVGYGGGALRVLARNAFDPDWNR